MAALLLISLLVIEALGLYGAYRDLRTGADGVRAAAATLGTQPAGWTPGSVAQAQRSLASARAQIDRGRARLEADPALSAASLVPGARDQVTAVRDLAAAAADTAQASSELAQVAALYSDTSASSGAPGSRVIEILIKSAPLLADAQSRLDRSLATINRDRGLRLLPPLRSTLDRAAVDIAKADQEVAMAAQLSSALPPALGSTSARKYLVILANPTELRPDGGFAGVVGTMTFDHGNPSAVQLMDQFKLNPKYSQKFPIPAPLARYMRFYDNSLELGDAGWDPDFPTTAQLAEQMWQSATKSAVDGVIELDPYAIGALLNVTGPVNVPGVGSFNSQNLLPQLNLLINVQGAAKDTTVPAVAEAVIKAILTTPGANWAKTASILLDQAQKRHIQLYAHDPALQKVIAANGFDGTVRPAGDSDYLMVVDANVGATKSDAYVQKAIDIKVEKPASGLTRHQVTATYSFPALQTDNDRRLNPKGPNNPAGAYRDYVRFYLPEAANLTGFRILVDGKPAFSNSVAENGVAHGKRVIGAFIELAPGHSGNVTITYEAPLDPAPSYRLLVQKQAGRPGLSTALKVSYPGGIADRKSDLVADSELEVSW